MVPNGWCIKRLDQVVSSVRKITYGIVVPGPHLSDGNLMIRAQDYSKGWNDAHDIYRVSDSVHESYRRSQVKEHDVLLTIVGSIGNTAIVPKWLEGANLTQQTARLAFEKHDPFYFYSVISSSIGQKEIYRYAKSGVQPSLNLSDVAKFKVPVPPLPEQRKIAKILSTWDKAIITNEKLIETSKQQKKALMQQLLTGKKRLVNPETGKAFEGDWEEVKVSTLITKHTEKTETNKQYPVLTSSRKGIYFQSDYYNDRDVASEDTTGYNVVPRGYFTYRHMSDDLVFKFNRNTICDKGIVSTLYPVFAAKEEAVVPYLLQAILNEGSAFKRFSLSQKQGGSRTYMYLSKLNELKIQIPSLTEQQKIASVLAAADKEIEVLEGKLAHFKQEKKALMQQLLTGKRRVKVDEMEVA